MSRAPFGGLFQGFVVHPGDHAHLARKPVLGDRREEPPFVECEVRHCGAA